jgi:hypothetical protein
VLLIRKEEGCERDHDPKTNSIAKTNSIDPLAFPTPDPDRSIQDRGTIDPEPCNYGRAHAENWAYLLLNTGQSQSTDKNKGAAPIFK